MQVSERSRTWAWILYDAANSAFGTIIVTAYFILYFKTVVVGDPHRGDFLWGLSISLAMAILALISPILGSIADLGGHRRKFLIFFTFLCIVTTSLLTTVGQNDILHAMVLFILAQIGYEGGIIFYDSFLAQVSPTSTMGKISGYGYAVGYAGGILSLLISYPFLTSTSDGKEAWSTWPFVLVSIQFLIFSLPSMFLLRDYSVVPSQPKSFLAQISSAVQHLLNTLRRLREYRDLVLLLIAYFIFFDGIITVITFSAAFAHDTLGFALNQILFLVLVANIAAIPGSILGGWACDRIGGRLTILFSLGLWIIIILGIVFNRSQVIFFVLTGFVGIGLGSTQGATRALFAKFTPRGDEGRFFALKGICGKLSSILGPFLFGTISYITSNQRWAVATLLIFFIVGIAIVYSINESRGIQRAS